MQNMKLELRFEESRAVLEVESTPEMDTVALTVRELDLNEEKSSDTVEYLEDISVTQVYLNHEEAESFAESLLFLARKNGRPDNE
ncbi:hypothetical protein [Halobacillus aidingensis]|uniref:Uncharacterized protein n=1 Tax=Halobacillus aidingensis TaxID=240303 RepID=A0A1H0MJ54_HALAD|nr:hypothetical protein [Halobacillus aidingensis]SDO80381.1 hypothetical protein SAMN05421677_10853 [Halobacillus aidingensis]